ncbi:hypothetical protein PTSG_01937 [Salpingoeca rosetta]|uniref:Sulfotransferase domain-containing protein n=1 Tax=Salpingoeca rosetta (strain ATCC 50818 / BSB-021) TaxID=946362 RepID=F2TZD9_SALR5|nr:uncharacterized protein PTSG_01937 [Salpingoeca rosetta]EGD78963.1 hypothetical protein PTSG_01937 [Salpingoeca rosetta]|eukprot:XP_004997919.1 hypothetical protein PTSG_01937 [Salpingoeca rosetta]
MDSHCLPTKCTRQHRDAVTASYPSPKRLDRFRWLHIPKTGTSFAATLYSYACPQLPRNVSLALPPGLRGSLVQTFEQLYPFEQSSCNGSQWIGKRAGHSPITPKELRTGETRVEDIVTMVRDPRLRLWSAYRYGKHAHGMLQPEWERMDAETHSVREFARWPGVAGCQVKMLTGHVCASRVDVTDALTDEAIRVMQAAAFVGITELWGESICLFHAKFGGRVHDAQFVNLRNTTTFQRVLPRRPPRAHRLTPEDDPHDWRLFQAAMQRFRRDQLTYAVPVPRGT